MVFGLLCGAGWCLNCDMEMKKREEVEIGKNKQSCSGPILARPCDNGFFSKDQNDILFEPMFKPSTT